jgi:hypothetical protein
MHSKSISKSSKVAKKRSLDVQTCYVRTQNFVRKDIFVGCVKREKQI